MSLPRHILQRVERLYSYHQRTKIMATGARVGAPQDPKYKLLSPRVFSAHSKTPLPTTVLDASIGTLSLLAAGQDALPDSLRAPPQDLKTLASWLFYAAGETLRKNGPAPIRTRTFPDAQAMLACEVYVAVFGLVDFDPGLYHFCPREFSLRKLREGVNALMQIKKGRPDLEFLKTLPAAILVSGTYWPAVWRSGRRGYRNSLIDVGQMVQNLVTAGAGLGAQTMTRLRMNDSTMRELIGLPPDQPLATAESIHAMVAWADRAQNPIAIPNGQVTAAMPAIPRAALSAAVFEDSASNESLLVHQDCIAPGVAVRELRPPLTEMSPLPDKFPVTSVKLENQLPPGLPVRQVMLDRQAKVNFSKRPISRPDLLAINHVAFQGGSVFPMFPDGAHVATVRPFWIVHDVTGLDRGIWYYNPMKNGWCMLNAGLYRREARYIAGDQDAFGEAAAVCVLMANLHGLMTQGGPDAYRLAHLETGIVSQRLYLAATSLNLATVVAQDFYDEDARQFLGLSRTGWEALALVALGPR